MTTIEDGRMKMLIHQVRALKKLSRYNLFFEVWRNDVLALLARRYGSASSVLDSFRQIKYVPTKGRYGDLSLSVKMYQRGLDQAATLLADLLNAPLEQFDETNLLKDVEAYLCRLNLKEEEIKEYLHSLGKKLLQRQSADMDKKAWDVEILTGGLVKDLHELIILKGRVQ